MAKAELTAVVRPKCQKIADQLGFELVDVCLDRENTGKYLRIYIDRPEGMDLDGCERYHRAVQPLLEAYDYDFLEVSSPGVDRPLKTERDFEKALGSEVEVRFFGSVDGRKEVTGVLADFDEKVIRLEVPGGNLEIERRQCATIRVAVDMSGVEEVDLSDTSDLKEGETLE